MMYKIYSRAGKARWMALKLVDLKSCKKVPRGEYENYVTNF